MQRLLALLLVFFLVLPSAFAGVSSEQAKFAGGTTNAMPLDAVGFLDAKDQQQLNFKYMAGKNGEVGKFPEGMFSLPYVSITRFTYGDVKHLRVGQTIALAALAGVGGLLLLFSKSHTHYLNVDYKDEQNHDQMISFEVGKDAIQPIIDSLQVRTGKKVEMEVPAAMAAAEKKP
jgi:hypothetical protein